MLLNQRPVFELHLCLLRLLKEMYGGLSDKDMLRKLFCDQCVLTTMFYLYALFEYCDHVKKSSKMIDPDK